MNINCIYYMPHGYCRLSQDSCNRVRHLTCFYERLKPVGKEQKKEEQKKIEGVLK